MNAVDFVGEGEMVIWVVCEIFVGCWVQLQEVVKFLLFLVSDDVDYIYGIVMIIDGGWIMK